MAGRLGHAKAGLELEGRAHNRAGREGGADVNGVLYAISLSSGCLEGKVHLGGSFTELSGELLLAAEGVGLGAEKLDSVIGLNHFDALESSFVHMRVENRQVGLLFNCET